MQKRNIHIDLVDSDRPELRAIRRRVFIEEQNVPEALEWDENDATARHFLLYLDDTAIACARLKTDGQIGRMAVLRDFRKQGYGGMLLQHVLRAAAAAGFRKISLHAQASAISFYEKHGFSVQGEEFIDAGIVHRVMSKKL